MAAFDKVSFLYLGRNAHLLQRLRTIGYRSMNRSIERKQSELDARLEKLKVLQPAADQYYNVSLPEFENMETRIHQIRNQLPQHDELFPILDHEFVITKIDGDHGSGERKIFISVPRSGEHQLRIQRHSETKR